MASGQYADGYSQLALVGGNSNALRSRYGYQRIFPRSGMAGAAEGRHGDRADADDDETGGR